MVFIYVWGCKCSGGTEKLSTVQNIKKSVTVQNQQANVCVASGAMWAHLSVTTTFIVPQARRMILTKHLALVMGREFKCYISANQDGGCIVTVNVVVVQTHYCVWISKRPVIDISLTDCINSNLHEDVCLWSVAPCVLVEADRSFTGACMPPT